jgi:AraC-like DNA-binding protein
MGAGSDGDATTIDRISGQQPLLAERIGPDRIEVAQFVPPPELAPFVTQIYHFRCEESVVRDSQPAALGHLVFFIRGSGSLRFEDGHVDHVHPASFFGPGTASAEFDLSGPMEDFGLALSPLGIVALTGKPAPVYSNRLVDASEIFGEGIAKLAKQFAEGRRAGTLSVREMVEQVTRFLLPFRKSVPSSHIGLIREVIDWLSGEFDPDVEAIFARLPMSRSTSTRLIRHYFGSAPKPLMRKYRALRAASMLIDPNCTNTLRAQIESLFYDQPHMIREIRQFAGRTPGRWMAMIQKSSVSGCRRTITAISRPFRVDFSLPKDAYA